LTALIVRACNAEAILISLSRYFRRLSFGPSIANAGPVDDLEKVWAAVSAQKSWHQAIALPGGKTDTIDYVAPQRWRMQHNGVTHARHRGQHLSHQKREDREARHSRRGGADDLLRR
jgi:hypothetical protein